LARLSSCRFVSAQFRDPLQGVVLLFLVSGPCSRHFDTRVHIGCLARAQVRRNGFFKVALLHALNVKASSIVRTHSVLTCLRF
jgi:hypothetical protein